MSINDMTLEEQIVLLRKDGYLIREIDFPCEILKLAAVESDGGAICHIPNPSIELQFAAVRECPMALQYIKKPNDEVILLAAEIQPASLSTVRKLSRYCQTQAFKNAPLAFLSIKKPGVAVRRLLGQYLDGHYELHASLSAKEQAAFRLLCSTNFRMAIFKEGDDEKRVLMALTYSA